jgi:hypothetical protein
MKLTEEVLKALIKEELGNEDRCHDIASEGEIYNTFDKPLSNQEIFGEFQNFVEINNLGKEDILGMVEILFSEVMEISLTDSPSMEYITPENIMMVVNVLKDLGLLAVPTTTASFDIAKMLEPKIKKDLETEDPNTDINLTNN